MSTEKNNIGAGRIALLSQMNEIIFHASDLAILWKIKNQNTLYTTLKRYSQQKLIFRIYKGLYSLKEFKKLNPYLIGIKALHRYAYISCESVLVNEGVLNQPRENITLISEKSLKFKINEYSYASRKLNPKFLYIEDEIYEKDGIRIASLERAVADMLYFNPHTHFDAKQLIDFKKVKSLQKKIGY
jgi:hypothetical protein